MDLISLIASLLFLGISAILYLRSQIPQQTIKNYKDLTDGMKARIDLLEAESKEEKKQNIENVKAIAELQGQLKVYKEIPLQQIADSMKNISEVNSKILSFIDK